MQAASTSVRAIGVARGARFKSTLAAAVIAAFFVGCASVSPIATQPLREYEGRLALTVHQATPQTWQARFRLEGTGAEGRLTLISPIGTTLALASWTPGSALIQRGNEVNEYPSADAMLNALIGSGIQMAQLWRWVTNDPNPVPAWQVDQETRPDQSRIVIARRVSPEPALTFKLLLQP